MTTYAFEAQTAAFVRSVEQGPPTEGLSLDQLRTGYRDTVIANSVVAHGAVATEDIVVPLDGRSLQVRLYVPAIATTPGPLLVYVHGGGFAVGDLESHDRLIRLIASRSGIRVLAIDYRRAPENPYPAALEDVLGVFRWVQVNAGAIGVDADRVALGGESAGATHAVMAALALGHSDARPALLWAFVPALDPTGSGESHKLFATGAGRTATEFAYLWSLYLPDEAMRDDRAIAPVFADASVLPRTFFYTAEFDPARDDGENFAARAKASGVDVTLKRQAGLVHQFPEITGISPASLQAVTDASRDLANALSGA
jgi:acetyl esterase